MTIAQLRNLFPEATENTWHQHPNGKGWVENTAFVEESVFVGGNAQVFGNARVYGNAQFFGKAWVYGKAWGFECYNITTEA